RDRRPAHEPAIPGYGRMVEQVVLDDVIELLIGVVRGDTLIKAVADVVGILFRRHPRIVLEAAALHLAAIADGGPFRPEEAGGGLELVAPLLVDAEHDGAEITDPSLIARGIARHVEGSPWAVGMHHQGR